MGVGDPAVPIPLGESKKIIFVLHFSELGGPHNLMPWPTAPFRQNEVKYITVLPEEPGSDWFKEGGGRPEQRVGPSSGRPGIRGI